MPTYIQGDLIASDETVIAHGCNALGKYGRGFALAVKENYPFAHSAYANAFETRQLKLGSVVWAVGEGKLIANCITQPTYGRGGLHLDYTALRSCMAELNRAGRDGLPSRNIDGFDRVAMPLIGADRGGGDWNLISAIIDEELVDVQAVVYHLPGSNFRPPEPLLPGL